jgi:hypothetical protein
MVLIMVVVYLKIVVIDITMNSTEISEIISICTFNFQQIDGAIPGTSIIWVSNVVHSPAKPISIQPRMSSLQKNQLLGTSRLDAID